MSEKAKGKRLFQVLRELNLKQDTVVSHLKGHGFEIGKVDPNTKLSDEMYMSLLDSFAKEKAAAERHKRWVEEEKQRKDQRQVDADEEDFIPASEPVAVPEPVVEVAPEPTPMPEPIPEVAEAPAPEPVPEVAPVVTAPAPVPAPAVTPEPVAEVPAVVEPEPVPEVVPVMVMPEPVVVAEPEPIAEIPAPEPIAEAVVAAVTQAVPEAPPVAEEVVVPKASGKPEKKKAVQEPAPEVEEGGLITADRYVLEGPKVLGRVDLNAIVDSEPGIKRKKRKRKGKKDDKPVSPAVKVETPAAPAPKPAAPQQDKKKKKGNEKDKKKLPVISKEAVNQAISDTKSELNRQGKERQNARLRRREKRAERAEQREHEEAQLLAEEQKLRVVEYVSANELANMMDIPVTEIIRTCLELGMMVSINQRLEADTIQLIAEEFGVEVEFVTDIASDEIEDQEDAPEDLSPRAPVVTIMGHVDHGKTSLLDNIRKSSVVTSEAGGITQHIGAYSVVLESGERITFLDTPGHEAFTAMRARGAQVTDLVILVVAADDAVMPQTIEAINHARAAGVPIVVAVNKIDKDGANIDNVLQQLAHQDVLVENWGGSVQCSLISAKKGINIDGLLEKVILESEILELKANPDRRAVGTIIESRIDKGRGIVATVLVQKGTLKVGDYFVSGAFHGKVRAMFDEYDKRIKSAGPSQPALIVGFTGSPDVGDKFVVMEGEREAKDIAGKRQQIAREQSMRQRKHLTLDEIGRRLALGEFKELNIIIKADVGGSVQALTDSLLKLSTPEVQVRIIHNGVGAITESDVMLASASDAVIIGFQVRASTPHVRRLIEQEAIDFRTYSVIYDAIEDVRDALEGLLSPETSEKTLGVAQVREVFRVPKVGTIAGCMITEGKLARKDSVRLIRDGVVIWHGRMGSLRRFKDPVNEVVSGYECGLSLENQQDIQVGDQIESFEVVQTKRRLKS